MHRHELAKPSNIQYNSMHVHKSNVKLHKLDVYSQHIVVIYLPMYIFPHFQLLAIFIHVLYSLIFTKSGDMLNKNT